MRNIILTGWLMVLLAGCTKDEIDLPATVPYRDNTIEISKTKDSLPWEINGMVFLNASTGFYITSGSYNISEGTIYKTIDGGLTWERKHTENSGPLTGIFFTDAQTGYVFGTASGCFWNCDPGPAMLLKTTDGGNTWRKIVLHEMGNGGLTDLVSNGGGVLYASASFDKRLNNSGISIYTGKILKSQDGGETWISMRTTNYALYDIEMNQNTIFCTGASDSVLQSADNGTIWTAKRAVVMYPKRILNLKFNQGVGYLNTDEGRDIYRTTDNGVTWELALRSNTNLYHVALVTKTKCLLLGRRGYTPSLSSTDQRAQYFLSTNTGNNWSSNFFEGVGTIGVSSFYSENEGYALAFHSESPNPRYQLLKIKIP